ncbi:MAG: hypothetical protein G01um10147_344 [Microgenomates group bacterium Gr01-1014_7]|nr:MAG: hypothetical protein G01um10147_344 [Microgenomates group bacterium Gr01-1014_7]
MNTTQQHLLISDVKDDLVLLKNGGGVLILQVSAVNFGLLSEREQMGIIFTFAQMLNSLSFSIQIFVYSERLNISSYLTLLDKAQKAQTNPLLSRMIGNYRQFIRVTIKENDVLDKKFYLVIPLYSLELGLTASKESLEQKIKTVLLPRRDQIIRQLNRVGLRATQLDNQKLIELFYNIYNGYFVETIPAAGETEKIEVSLKKPQPIPQSKPNTVPSPQAQETSPLVSQPSRTHPFVVEELEE